MKLKSYFADTVEAAVALAGKELGPEAMLVYSRQAQPEARYLGRYEVVFALPPQEKPAGENEPAAPGKSSQIPGARPAAASWDGGQTLERLSQEVSALRRQIERMAGAFARTTTLAYASAPPSGAMAGVCSRLLDAEVSPELVQAVVSRLEKAPAEAGDLNLRLRRELGGLFQTDSRLGHSNGGARTVALIGPPGSGKTATLVKLAVAYGLGSRRPAQLLSMDMHRIGGADQLRSYAGILGIGFQCVETPGALAQALEEYSGKDLILIDTPGYSESDVEAATELARAFTAQAEVDVHLTLSASMKTADLRRAVDRYERFQPNKLLFTRLDETTCYGSILNEAVRTGRAISFLTNGQQIPEDLLEASRDTILNLILSEGIDEPEAPRSVEQAPQTKMPIGEQPVGSAAAAA